MTPEELRDDWLRLVADEGGLDRAFAERAYDCAHRIGRGAGRLEALRTVKETGSVIAACDAFTMLNGVELMLSEVEE